MQIATIDIDESDGLKKKYDVTAVPTILGLTKGSQGNKYVGPMMIDSNAEEFVEKVI